MKYLIILPVFLVLLAGCVAVTQKMNGLAIGMTKGEVLQVLGSPNDTRATEEIEYLVYMLAIRLGGPQSEYFVQLKQGRVVSYGKVGDFGSTQDPEATININKTTKEIK